MAYRFVFCVVVFCWPCIVTAQPGSLFSGGAIAEPLFAVSRSVTTTTGSTTGPSLFHGAAMGMFAPLPESVYTRLPLPQSRQVARLRDLIAKAEAGRMGYDAVQYGARIKPPKPPTQMSLAEIIEWIEETPGQPHAIGRYQIIPSTLAHLIEKADVPLNARFGPALQDRFANILLEQAGLRAFLAGETKRAAFMQSIARVWAGLPTPSGKSYYEGYAGNKATMTWAKFDASMSEIFAGVE